MALKNYVMRSIHTDGRQNKEASPVKPTDTFGLKVLHENSQAVADVVLLHGLTGDRERTWTSPRTHKLWARDFLPSDLPETRVLTFGYDAYLTRLGLIAKNHIREHAAVLLSSLSGLRQSPDTNKRPIIFVAHSLGGLLCKDAILLSASSPESHLAAISAHTQAILFMASPHQGSRLAEWARIPANIFNIVKDTNTKLLSVLDLDSEVRDRIHAEFMMFLRKRETSPTPIRVTCLFETLKLGLFMIVPRKSATLDGYVNLSVHADHRDIARFDTDKDQTYMMVLDELKRWTAQFHSLLNQCISSLRFPEIWNRKSIIARGVEGSCRWIRDSKEYKAWNARERLDLSHGIFWIKGKPGSGKSTVMKDLCETTDVSHLGRDALRLTFFFNKRGASLEKTLPGLYRSLLCQILKSKGVEDFTSPILMRFKQKTTMFDASNVVWDLVELKDVFYEMIECDNFPPVEIFTDALDECDEDQVREFIRRMAKSAKIAQRTGRTLNVCWSSRHYPQITVPHCLILHMEDGNSNDIERFVQDGLAVDLSERDVLKLGNEIVKRAQGVFFWASLVLQKLNKASDEGRCRGDLMAILRSLPEEADALLREIILSIPSDSRTDCLHLFQWLMYSPGLQLNEVELALTLSDSRTSRRTSLEEWAAERFGHSENFFSDSYPGDRVCRYVTTISGGLAEVVAVESDPSILQFIHQSVPDFLLQESIQETLGISTGLSFWEWGLWMMLDTISAFLLSPELDFVLSYTPTNITIASRRLIGTAKSWVATPFGRKIFSGFFIECLHNTFSTLLVQGNQSFPLPKLQQFARCCSKLLLRAISMNEVAHSYDRGILIEHAVKFMLMAGEQQLESALECSLNRHEAREMLNNPGHETAATPSTTSLMPWESDAFWPDSGIRRAEQFCELYDGPLCAHGIEFMESSLSGLNIRLWPLMSCTIESKVHEGERSISVKTWGRDEGYANMNPRCQRAKAVNIPLGSLMIDFEDPKDRHAYQEMLFARFPLGA